MLHLTYTTIFVYTSGMQSVKKANQSANRFYRIPNVRKESPLFFDIYHNRLTKKLKIRLGI